MEWIEHPMERNIYALRMNDNYMGVEIYKPYEYTSKNWHLCCKILNIDGQNLETEDFDKAVTKAQKIIDKKLNKIYFRLREFTLNVGENVMIRY